MRVYRVNASLRRHETEDQSSPWFSGRCLVFDLHAEDYLHAKLEAEAILRDTCEGMLPEFWNYNIDFIVPTVFPSYPRSER